MVLNTIRIIIGQTELISRISHALKWMLGPECIIHGKATKDTSDWRKYSELDYAEVGRSVEPIVIQEKQKRLGISLWVLEKNYGEIHSAWAMRSTLRA
jgi:hypothetical protein